MASRLKTCPFCGADIQEINLRNNSEAMSRAYYSISHICHFGDIYISVIGDTYDKVVEVWNNRKENSK